MLENQSCLIARALPSSCEEESKWVYMTCHLIEVSNGKRRLEDEVEEGLISDRKSLKREDDKEEFTEITSENYSLSLANGSYKQAVGNLDQKASRCGSPSYDQDRETLPGKRKLGQEIDLCGVIHGAEEMVTIPDYHQSSYLNSRPDEQCQDEYQVETNWELPLEDRKKNVLLLNAESSKGIDSNQRDDMTHNLNDLVLSPIRQADQMQQNDDQTDMTEELVSAQVDQDNQEAQGVEQAYTDSLIHPLGRDMSINCLLCCSRSEYNTLAKLNRGFRNLIQNGALYRLRSQMGVIEHWVYFSCHALQWEAFDPISRRWMRLPPMRPNECFMFSDKESLAVGTELLVFGKEIISHVIWRYSILTNSWSSGMEMKVPRCLFGSASLGDIAILAGGCDSRGQVLDTAELYNSDTGNWEILPSMNKPRKMCSGVFMDGKFYVIGGRNKDLLTCGEEYNLETRTWREIPNMSPRQNGPAEAPPLVAVVNNELYTAVYAENELMKFDKERVSWVTVGRLPERAVSVNGWGLAFRACGEHLIVISGPRSGGGIIELNSWVPNDGPPQWNLLASRHSGSFVYNCAVMGC